MGRAARVSREPSELQALAIGSHWCQGKGRGVGDNGRAPMLFASKAFALSATFPTATKGQAVSEPHANPTACLATSSYWNFLPFAGLPEALSLWDQVQMILLLDASAVCALCDRFCVTQWHASYLKYFHCWQNKSALPTAALSLLGENGKGALNINAAYFSLPWHLLCCWSLPSQCSLLSFFFLIMMGAKRDLWQDSEGTRA